MEEDRIQVDLGIAADLEDAHISQHAVKRPKRRFVGRRAAEEASLVNPGAQNASSIEDMDAIQGIFSVLVNP